MILHNFIAFEGLDGSGTTTQLGLLRSFYDKKGLSADVFFTQEPTNGGIGKLIRSVLSGIYEFTPDTVAMLFAADRMEHLYGKGGILEALNEGKTVFTDRYVFSSLAYQTAAGAGGIAEKQNNDFPLPQYLFFMDLPVKDSFDRVNKRGTAKELYEKEAFQLKVREEYLRFLRFYKEKEPEMIITVLNALQPPETISKTVLDIFFGQVC